MECLECDTNCVDGKCDTKTDICSVYENDHYIDGSQSSKKCKACDLNCVDGKCNSVSGKCDICENNHFLNPDDDTRRSCISCDKNCGLGNVTE